MIIYYRFKLCFIMLLIFLNAHSIHLISKTFRPSNWAVPITLKGVENVFKIDEFLYRGSQPTKEGFISLQKLGIKTVVNLRKFHSDVKMIKGLGFKYFPIGLNTWKKPELKDIRYFIDIVRNKENTPVYLHCQHGSDRTGTFSAIYRIIVHGWSKENALKEMIYGGFGFHYIWSHLIDFILSTDFTLLNKINI